jgi:uncharacterized protein
MRVWIDLANSPHVPLFEPVVAHLRGEGWEVVVTARDHAQTVELARIRWPDVTVIGGESPGGRAAKAFHIANRAVALREYARSKEPTVALSHGSYAQVLAARAARVPAVTMMDYEHQPANHVSFRLARRVIVPDAFPDDALRRFGAAPQKVIRYAGFKEELYLSGFRPDPTVLDELGLDPARIIAVLRPPPEGALYHRHANPRFAELFRLACAHPNVRAVLLPRTRAQASAYGALGDGAVIPPRAVDARSLIAAADLTIGAGGTMNRESALLGTPTYTVFTGRIPAVDRELMRRGLLHDVRADGSRPIFEKKRAGPVPAQGRGAATLDALDAALDEVAR